MKFGVAALPYIGVTERAALELGYVQKLFGYDAPATQLFYAGARAAFWTTGVPATSAALSAALPGPSNNSIFGELLLTARLAAVS
jgi:hypothetical protein